MLDISPRLIVVVLRPSSLYCVKASTVHPCISIRKYIYHNRENVCCCSICIYLYFSAEGVPENSLLPTVYSTVAICDGLYIVKLQFFLDTDESGLFRSACIISVFFVYCVRSIILTVNNKSSTQTPFIMWIVCG